MTAEQAYAADPTFRALVDTWAADRFCPTPLPDRCEELDMPGPARVARWVLRRVRTSSEYDTGGYAPGTYNIYPALDRAGPRWFCYAPDLHPVESDLTVDELLPAHWVPKTLMLRDRTFDDVPAALCHLLDCSPTEDML